MPSGAKVKKKKKEEVNVLWVNKYKPQSIDDLVGNATNAKRLLSWLQQWYVNMINSNPSLLFSTNKIVIILHYTGTRTI